MRVHIDQNTLTTGNAHLPKLSQSHMYHCTCANTYKRPNNNKMFFFSVHSFGFKQNTLSTRYTCVFVLFPSSLGIYALWFAAHVEARSLCRGVWNALGHWSETITIYLLAHVSYCWYCFVWLRLRGRIEKKKYEPYQLSNAKNMTAWNMLFLSGVHFVFIVGFFSLFSFTICLVCTFFQKKIMRDKKNVLVDPEKRNNMYRFVFSILFL